MLGSPLVRTRRAQLRQRAPDTILHLACSNDIAHQFRICDFLSEDFFQNLVIDGSEKVFETVMHYSKSYLQKPYRASRAFSTHAIYSKGNIFPSFLLQTSGLLSAFAEPYLGTFRRPQCFTLRGLRLSNQNHFQNICSLQERTVLQKKNVQFNVKPAL